MDKMFNANRASNSVSVNNSFIPSQQVERLHKNMNNAFHGQRQNKLNNIVKKWK